MTKSYQSGSLIAERWEVHKVLGGGMGVVYIVYDHTLKEPFALKTYRDEIFQRAPEAADRFRQEALTWINLDVHANIAQARLVTTIDGKPYLVLEYVSGGDLEARIGTPELIDNPQLILRFALQFCDGMMHAVAKGIKAHRDVKPQNCLITHGEILKITDFGLAKVLEVGPTKFSTPATAGVDSPIWPSSSGTCSFLDSKISAVSSEPFLDLTRTGVGAGTCTHMAPEQFADAKRVDARADVYSFGVMLFQMVTGRLPFPGRTWQELETLHKTQPPPALTGLLAGALNPIVRRCLCKDPAERYSSFSLLRAELANVFKEVVGKPAPTPVIGPELEVFHLSNKGTSLCNLGRTKEGLACFDQALKTHPNSATVWYNKGVYLGKTEEALACYQEALGIAEAAEQSGDGGWWEFRLEQAWFNMAVVLEDLGDPGTAIECYEGALSLNPRYEKGLIGKGSCLESLGRGDEAIRCFDDTLAVNPRSVGALACKGVAVSKLGCLDEALTLLSAAVEIDPECVMALYNRGLVLGKLGRNEEEIACYDRALSVNPRHAKSWYNKGLALGELGRPEEEIACYDHTFECDPNHWEACFNKGSALVEFHRYEEAIQSFEAAQQLGAEEAGERIEFCRWAMNRRRRS